MDIPRIFTISESDHRIHNPFTPDKFVILGEALRLPPGTAILDLGSGSGEMLCTWARDHGIVGAGIDMSPLFTEQANARAAFPQNSPPIISSLGSTAFAASSPIKPTCSNLSGQRAIICAATTARSSGLTCVSVNAVRLPAGSAGI